METSFGLAHLWAQGDTASHAVAILLLLMSVASWSIIVSKVWQGARLKRAGRALDEFWNAPGLREGVALLTREASEGPLASLAHRGEQAAEHYDRHASGSLGGALERGEFLTRALRQSIVRSQAKVESGLTLLASVGSTAPFVGLFGTVWGIYHALVGISVSGQASLDKVAGPVGEALIMTAAGLAVAIPAVLAYNAFTRGNRILLAELDAFAHDLHAFLTTGARMPSHVRPTDVAAGAPVRLQGAA
jgi:biopolymer transport protein ExbB